jgi:hypothetical protein
MRLRTHVLFVVTLLWVVPRTVLGQTTPPTVSFTSPPGLQQGTTRTFVIEGTDLQGASAIVFSEPGVSGEILEVGPVPESRLALETKAAVIAKPYFQDPLKMEAKVEVTAEKWVAAGTHQFRIITPHGSSTPGKFVVGTFPELEEHEPNNAAAQAQSVSLPITINGSILSAGDVDQYRFQASSGQEMVLQVDAAGLGSSLDPVVEIYDSQGHSVASNLHGTDRSSLGYRISESGSYTVQVSDYLEGGSLRHFYRLTMGAFPLLRGRYPLGLKAGTTRQFHVWGYNLGEAASAAPEPFGLLPGKRVDIGGLSSQTRDGETANMLPIAIGLYDEVDETGRNNSLEGAQELKLPITVNGRISLDAAGKALPDYYRFRARKGSKLILETMASRLGSPLDSLLEVLDASGNLVPRLGARPVWKTQITLFDRDSKSPGLRLNRTSGLELNDYMVAGTDLMRVVKLTNGPDEDVTFENFNGQRLGIEDTTPEAHALDDFIYKVELHPPGAQFPPNGMPVFHFFMRNDDGGPGYGKDSQVTFTAPEDGFYYVRVADVGNRGGDDFAYRLTIREPAEDFLISASPVNPNIPEGSKVPVEVAVLRREGFQGPIRVEFDNLAKGLTGTSGIIPRGEDSVTLLLSLAPGARLQGGWARFRILGKANLGSEEAVRVANEGDRLKVISSMPEPDVKVYVKDKKIRISPDGEAQMTLGVQRFNGFRGRVLFRIQDLPYGVRPINVGLNGVMIAENETERTFTLECRSFVKPGSRQVLAVGTVEALVPTEHPSEPVTLEVIGAEHASK